MDNILPVVFQALQGEVAFVRKVTENEYHSSCPRCGIEGHKGDEEPDRFTMWLSSKFTGKPFAMCRRCRYKWSGFKHDAHWTPEELMEFQRKQRELEAEWESKLAEKLDKLSEQIVQQGMWKRFHEDGMKSQAVRDYWEKVRHIPPEWQEYLGKGYIQDYTVKNHLTTYHRAAYTNPVWTFGGRIENIKLRVDNPLDANDRFRNYYKSGCQHLYVSEYDVPPAKKVVVVEGENKCDAISIWGDLSSDYTVVGVQSKQPEKRILKMLDRFEVVYLALDPDAYEPTIYYDKQTGEEKKAPPSVMDTAKKIGMERVRFVVPPKGVKFDDALFQGFRFKSAVNMSVKAICR